MPPDLGRAYAPDWAGHPPHMAPRDVALWLRGRDELTRGAVAVYYDAAVGEGSPAGDPAGDPLAEAWARITRKRIDAVIEHPGRWVLIEVRPNAGLGALGAITTYRALWDRDPPDMRPVDAMILTDRAEPDTERTAINSRIAVVVV